ncbi:MAG: hypothetical protein ISN28_09065 [Ectothiorhodospiraceae bacterium AqS1]|nr:hypothetical protein [Ectothiorhodospiraceae bacterium AqS1]
MFQSASAQSRTGVYYTSIGFIDEVREGESYTRTFRVSVPVGHSRPGTVKFTLASSDTKALAINPSVITISAWPYKFEVDTFVAETDVTLTAVQDADANDESVDVDITNDDEDSDSSDAYQYDIEDDDDNAATGSIVVTPSGNLSITEGASGNVSVKLGAAPNSTETITPSTRSRLLRFSPSSLDFTTSNWNTAQSITVTANEDDDYRQRG